MERFKPLSGSFGLLLTAALLCGSLETTAQFTGDSFAEAKVKGTANVTYTFIETPGFAAKEGANVEGFCLDLMSEFGKWLLKEEGVTLKPVLQDRDAKHFSRFMEGMKKSSGGVFGLGTFTITEERKKEYTFSDPFISNVAVLMTHKNVPNLQSLEKISEDFSGMTMVTVKGSFNEKRLLEVKAKHFPQVKVKYVGSFDEVLRELSTNEKAFTELDFTFYVAALKQRMPLKHHPINNGTADSMGLIMPKNSDWSPVLNRFLNSGYLQSTEYRRLIAKHLGQHALKLLDTVTAQ